MSVFCAPRRARCKSRPHAAWRPVQRDGILAEYLIFDGASTQKKPPQ